jgi:DNA modification methylase
VLPSSGYHFPEEPILSQILHGDANLLLPQMPEGLVDVVITSPRSRAFRSVR